MVGNGDSREGTVGCGGTPVSFNPQQVSVFEMARVQ